MIVFMTSVLLLQFSKMVFCCFPGGVAVPQYGPRGCAGPRLKAAPLQPKRSSPTTESHGAPVGARQCTPSPPSRMSNPEILSPPDLFTLCLSFLFLSFLLQTLGSLYLGFTATGFKLTLFLGRCKCVPISFYIVQSFVNIFV